MSALNPLLRISLIPLCGVAGILLSGCGTESKPVEAVSKPRVTPVAESTPRPVRAPFDPRTPTESTGTATADTTGTIATEQTTPTVSSIPQPTPTPVVAYDPELPTDTKPIVSKDEFRGAYAISMNGREALFNYVDDTYTPVGVLGAITTVTLRFDQPSGPVVVPMVADPRRHTYVADIPDSVPDSAGGSIEFYLSGVLTTGTIQIPPGRP
jgi:hypothetical protein